MQIEYFMRTAEYPSEADKAALGTINRPLQVSRYFFKLHHCALSRVKKARVFRGGCNELRPYISPYHGSKNSRVRGISGKLEL
jgi:hypothetical protein